VNIAPAAETPAPGRAMRLPQLPVFVLAIFLGSFLLFLVQPLFGRMLLPVMGGAPAVWATALVFFQGALLAGYLYAHLLQRLPLRLQLGAHLGLLALALLTLPLDVSPVDMGGREGGAVAMSLLGLMALSVGPVFLLVSAQAPLLQAWFARGGHAAAANPYMLYAASNAGSLLGLIAYPLLLEPFTGLSAQGALWASLYVALILLVGLSGAAVLAAGPRPPATHAAWSVRADAPMSWPRRLRWILLAAVPSGLLVSTTTHITTDIMALPLLWVLPLALYLLSFILVFAGSGPVVTRVAVFVAPFLLIVYGAGALLMSARAATGYGVLSLLLLFVIAVALHGTLAKDRPAPARLTEFYLIMSLGGVLGGIATALVAPLLFDWTWEHPLLILAAALLVPARPILDSLGSAWASRGIEGRILRVALPPITLALSWWLGASLNLVSPTPWMVAGLITISFAATLAIGRPLAFTWHLAMLMLAVGGWKQLDISMTEGARTRSFFGVYTIENVQSLEIRRLLHGTTMHGIQSVRPELENEPLSYYGRMSGVGMGLTAAPSLFGPGARIGFVGLGAGSMACYAREGQQWTAYEIDPAMVRLARDSGAFTYIARCAPDMEIIVGDARLKLADEPDGRFDMLAVDAFSSDAIPLHLMTREAFETYMRVLAPDGILLVHISNRYLDLEPVIGAVAAELGLSVRGIRHRPGLFEEVAGLAVSTSFWVALARDEETIEHFVALTASEDWTPVRDRVDFRAWTDDRASILPVLRNIRDLL
jgi:SAM-dependent methyltransferase